MSENKTAGKGRLCTAMYVTSAVFGFILFICIVFAVLFISKGLSVWIFGLSSAELLPVFTSVALLLTAIPLLTVLALRSKKFRALSIILSAVCVLGAAAAVLTIKLTSYDNFYTLNTSDDGKYTIVICEANKGDDNRVIFYQLLDDGITMQLVSVSECIAEGYRPFTEGNAEIQWNKYTFTVKVPDTVNEGGDFLRQMYKCPHE